jgi:hypothetical protein
MAGLTTRLTRLHRALSRHGRIFSSASRRHRKKFGLAGSAEVFFPAAAAEKKYSYSH